MAISPVIQWNLEAVSSGKLAIVCVVLSDSVDQVLKTGLAGSTGRTENRRPIRIGPASETRNDQTAEEPAWNRQPEVNAPFVVVEFTASKPPFFSSSPKRRGSPSLLRTSIGTQRRQPPSPFSSSPISFVAALWLLCFFFSSVHLALACTTSVASTSSAPHLAFACSLHVRRLLDQRYVLSHVNIGDKYDDSKVVRVDRGSGLLLEVPSIPESAPAFIVDIDGEIQKLEKKYKEGIHVRVPIQGLRLLEGLAIGSLKEPDYKYVESTLLRPPWLCVFYMFLAAALITLSICCCSLHRRCSIQQDGQLGIDAGACHLEAIEVGRCQARKPERCHCGVHKRGTSSSFGFSTNELTVSYRPK
ncbi:hypothetical protein PIB30_055342 [Stylosanthes scabra]|uniref:Rrp5 OB-fold domain-containing protein n=1 Tax=Stylosanthes scabra TaxID=79078 RepID=A0ABU6VK24_9FABA|nr:hypothetical protein [Stylosanthes scabra]